MIKLMKTHLIGRVFGTLAVAILACSGLAQADEWPKDNIRLIVPFSAGGTTDLLSRKVASMLQVELATNVIVENRPGAGTTLATGQLARAGRGADHMLLMASPGHGIGASLYPNLPYDPIKDFTFVRNLIDVPNVVAVPVNSPYNSIPELVEAARTKELTFSSSGIGTSIHMSGELFKSMADIDLVHVPFGSSGEMLPALLSGDVDVAFDNMPTVYPQVQAGTIKALAVTTPHESEFLPGVPSVQQAGKDYGLKGYEAYAWFGLIAHKSLPDKGLAKLQTALDKIMSSEEFKNFLPQFGAEAGTVVGDDFRQFVQNEVDKWSEVAEKINLKR